MTEQQQIRAKALEIAAIAFSQTVISSGASAMNQLEAIAEQFSSYIQNGLVPETEEAIAAAEKHLALYAESEKLKHKPESSTDEGYLPGE